MDALRPLRVPAFRRLAVSYSLNEIGWSFGAVALALLVYERTGNALAPTALFLATSFAPALLAPAVTARIDGMAARRALPALYAVEALVFCALAVLAGRFSLPAVLGLALFDGVVALTGRAVTRATVAAALKPTGQLRAGNAFLNVCFALSYALGPSAGGLVVSAAGVAASLLVAAGLFAVMALTLLTSRDLPAASPARSAPWSERLRQGLRHVRDDARVKPLLTVHAGAVVLGTTAVPIEVVYARSALHGGQAAYGVLLTAWGIGTVLGSMLFARAGRVPVLVLLAASLLAIGGGNAIMGLAPTIAVAAVGCFIGGAGNGVEVVAVAQALQERLTDDLQVRVMGLFESINAGCMGVGFLLGGVIAALAGTRPVFLVAAGGLVIAAAAALALTRVQTAAPVPVRRSARRAVQPDAA